MMVSRGATFIAPLPGTPPVGMSATDGRLALGGIFGLTPQLVSGGGVTQSGSAMQFTVAQSVFQLGDVTNAAATAFLPTDSIVLTAAVGPGTGSRIDLITIPLKNYENGDASSQSVPVLIAGTAGTPGVAPPVPVGSYKYAQIAVPTSATNAAACTVTIYGNTTFAPPFLSAPTLAKLNLTTGMTGQYATVTTDTVNNGLYQWSGTAWVLWVGDTGWITPTLGAGWTATSGNAPQYRRKNGFVWCRGSATTTGATTSAFTFNAGFLPDYLATGNPQYLLPTDNASGAAAVKINAAGVVNLVVGVTSTTYHFNMIFFMVP